MPGRLFWYRYNSICGEATLLTKIITVVTGVLHYVTQCFFYCCLHTFFALRFPLLIVIAISPTPTVTAAVTQPMNTGSKLNDCTPLIWGQWGGEEITSGATEAATDGRLFCLIAYRENLGRPKNRVLNDLEVRFDGPKQNGQYVLRADPITCPLHCPCWCRWRLPKWFF